MLRAYREQTMQYVIPHAERASTLETSFSWEKDHGATFFFLRGTLMFYLFVLSVMTFDSIAFHHLETHCLGRQAWRVPVLCSNPFPHGCIQY